MYPSTEGVKGGIVESLGIHICTSIQISASSVDLKVRREPDNLCMSHYITLSLDLYVLSLVCADMLSISRLFL